MEIELDETKKKIYGLYCRTSTLDQNIEQQKKLLTDYARKHHFSYRSYTDEGFSRKLSDRPEWTKLIKECLAGKICGIIVTKYDRITSDLGYAINFLSLIKEFKIEMISLYDGVFQFTPDQVFNFKLKCLLSEYELDQLHWRRQIGIERAKKEGKYKGRKKGSKNKK